MNEHGLPHSFSVNPVNNSVVITTDFVTAEEYGLDDFRMTESYLRFVYSLPISETEGNEHITLRLEGPNEEGQYIEQSTQILYNIID